MSVSFNASAQDAGRLRVVEVKEAKGEIIRRENFDNYDANGNLAAGLIIQSDMGGLTFTSSNGIIRQTQKGNEWRILISEDERQITVYGEGVLPLSIILSSNGIKLESGKFWVIQLASNITREKLPVILDINEGNPTLLINNEEVEYSPGSPQQLSIGQNIIQIEKNGFNPIIDTIEVSQENVFFEYELEETSLVNVQFRTEPSGATIRVAGTPVPGTTPETGFLPEVLYPGFYEVSVIRTGYLDYVGEITVIEGQKNEFVFPLIKNVGYLLVNSETPDAVFTIDDQPYDLGTAIELAPRNAPYVVSINATGYDDYSERHSITQGDTIKISQGLAMITGDIIVRSQPATASITMKKDGQVVETWNGTRSLRDIQVGNYEITASQNNFREETRTFELTRDATEQINFNLEQIDGVGSLTLTGLEGSNVTLRGPRRFNFENLPTEIATVPYGDYQLVVKKKGFKTITQDLTFRQSERSIDLLDNYVPKTKGKAFTRSLLFPGAGHIYLDRGGRGFLYLLAEGALIGLAVKSYQDFSANADAYSKARNDYLIATSNFDNLDQIQKTAFQAQQDSKDQLVLFLTALGAVKGLELFDVLLSKNYKKELRRAQRGASLSANPATASLSFNYNF
ncbi:MAG: PEGA domain-containing protein [Vicingaceae bacterium]